MTIVRSHGGLIRVDSEPDRGTRFDVYLPVAPKPSSGSTMGKRASVPQGQGQTVLVVDDEASVRRVLKATLEKGGYTILEAANGKEALSIYDTSGPNIAAVIMDMTMPMLGGMPTMREMVKINPEVRLIAVSGIHDNEQVATSIGPQVKTFLAKPFTSEMLLRAVSKAVAGS